MTLRLAAVTVLAGVLVISLSGCEIGGRSWNDAEYFEDYRPCPAENQRSLQQRVRHTQGLETQQQLGAHQVEYRRNVSG